MFFSGHLDDKESIGKRNEFRLEYVVVSAKSVFSGGLSIFFFHKLSDKS